jgi:hypothetical protein
LFFPLFQSWKSPRVAGSFLFLLYKFRIAGSDEKTAIFRDQEALIYQWSLLWVSGETLTRKAGNTEREQGTGTGTGKREQSTAMMARSCRLSVTSVAGIRSFQQNGWGTTRNSS